MHRAGQQLAALVVDRVLQQRLADALRHAALHLALDDHRVDHPADIVDRGEVHHLDTPVSRVDLDLADMAAAGKVKFFGS